MAVNSANLAGKGVIFAKNSLKPPFFGGFAAEKVKNLASPPTFCFFFSSARGGGSSTQEGILSPLCTRMGVGLLLVNWGGSVTLGLRLEDMYA